MTDLPWISEAKKHVGLQEVRDKKALMAYFATAGLHYDPSVTAWCGIGMATFFHNSLPKQPLPENPAWALNWLKFGVKCTPQVGSILVFSRNGGGHVAICLGQYNGGYVCLGCNQDNEICIEVHTKTGFQGARWPDTFSAPPTGPLMTLAAGDYKTLTNEA
ncbi:uncharacterized protein (TIGR02594 family) [Rhizobium sp. BK313]|uniref:CHAP domain-containing protein n=1 Tax=Rhizobium sp. BK313 TaxID=2587081 RepID=UPI0016108B32|nr:CHAP domain-containing protein [Rhizobium sp. BK313]MBB3453875.1 uncharacterized protein (TIGR02594 family) [Rhizobium sp. BK313]